MCAAPAARAMDPQGPRPRPSQRESAAHASSVVNAAMREHGRIPIRTSEHCVSPHVPEVLGEPPVPRRLRAAHRSASRAAVELGD